MNIEVDPVEWPPDLITALGAGVTLKRIETGESGASVFAVKVGSTQTHYLKIAPRDAQLQLDHDAAILSWLRGKLPVPEVLYAGADEANQYLLMTGIPGIDLSTEAARALDSAAGGGATPNPRRAGPGLPLRSAPAGQAGRRPLARGAAACRRHGLR
jgi:aminoglycoside phosphotransferase